MTADSPPSITEGIDAPLGTARLTRLDVHVFRAPIESPVRTSFGIMHDRPAVLVRVEDDDGAFGWGEIWCNWPACGAEHRARLAVSVLAPRLLGRAFASPEAASGMLATDTRILALQTGEFGPLAQAIAGFDGALWDLAARRAGLPLRRLLSATAGRQIPAYASGINPGQAVETIAAARDAGFRAFKVKIGFDPERDVDVVRAVADSLTGGERFMLDANQAWTPDAARDMASRLAALAPAWLEEPMPVDTPERDWRSLAAHSPIPLAGGENLATDDAFTAAIAAGHLQVLQPDICKWGGVSGCVRVARQALQAGRRYCPHYLGGGIGLLASAHVLAAVGGDGVLEVDINENPLRELLAQPYPPVADGEMTLPEGPGLGVEPDLQATRSWRVLELSERA